MTGIRPTRDIQTFTGSVSLRALQVPNEESSLAIYEVTFDAGARTHWHTHPLGQALYVTSGTARVQIGDTQPVDQAAGSYVWIPAETRHWHGAAPDAPMTHVAIQQAAEDGTTICWDEPVSDPEYSGRRLPG